LLIVLGNETKGPSSFLAQEGIKVNIPIVRAESLNVASAGAIFFYEASAQFP
jgi:tRNA G18 (ribose-2'-O)-methylase SpoU